MFGYPVINIGVQSFNANTIYDLFLCKKDCPVSFVHVFGNSDQCDMIYNTYNLKQKGILLGLLYALTVAWLSSGFAYI